MSPLLRRLRLIHPFLYKSYESVHPHVEQLLRLHVEPLTYCVVTVSQHRKLGAKPCNCPSVILVVRNPLFRKLCTHKLTQRDTLIDQLFRDLLVLLDERELSPVDGVWITQHLQNRHSQANSLLPEPVIVRDKCCRIASHFFAQFDQFGATAAAHIGSFAAIYAAKLHLGADTVPK